ncbi:hypothetical protein SISSUDRAFT_699036 [Sistotremastrum suecicum HHB10207 ss-3]|uniref:F-box domain-containing protein n=1 Tax=Sistotremastrum suecicum HHB10207 ss-3 TaxID=1314776 RepID=A0A166DYL2_9AGAM|nr:hypothetical protein SISSUDRAFT_699036 [Sistotremastrum suecicum HHB10207 ss-3]
MDRSVSCCSYFWITAELVAMAFQHLSENDLASCARVNRFISEHALDLLYSNSPYLTEFLKILAPMEHLIDFSNDRDLSILRFVRPLTPTDWDRFRHYSPRVRRLSEEYFSGIDDLSRESMLDLISTIPAGEAIFPFLHTLEWLSATNLTRPFVTSLCHETILNVEFSTATDDFEWGAFLKHLVRQCPNIESLGFWPGPSWYDQIEVDFHSAIKSLPRLHTLDTCDTLVTPEVLQELSHRPHFLNLWSCAFRAEEIPVHDPSEQMLDHQGAFPALSNVAGICSRIMRLPKDVLEGPSLTHLNVYVVDESNIPDLLALVSASCIKLRHFSLMTAPRSISNTAFTADTLKPLLALQYIEVFVVDHSVPPRINDEDLDVFARSFPRLQHFELCPRAEGEPQIQSPTLASLIPFAKHCRRLISIVVPSKR